MKWRRPHSRERPSHPEDDLRPHEAIRVPTLIISSRALARGISGPWMPRRSGGIETRVSFISKPTGVINSHGSALIWPWHARELLVAGTEGTADAEARRS